MMREKVKHLVARPETAQRALKAMLVPMDKRVHQTDEERRDEAYRRDARWQKVQEIAGGRNVGR
jgi:hypothetical protein